MEQDSEFRKQTCKSYYFINLFSTHLGWCQLHRNCCLKTWKSWLLGRWDAYLL